MNRLQIWKALAKGVVLESIRRKDLWVVAILGFVILIASGAIGFFGFSGLEAFAKDLAATVLGGFSTVLAVVTTARLVPDEVKNRTLYPLLARPITRFDLLAGKLLGAIAVSWVSFLLLCALTVVALSLFRVQFEPVMAQYVLLKMLGLVVVCSFTMLLSLLMTYPAAVTMSFVLLFGTNMIVHALTMASATADAGTRTVYQVITAILPQIQLFDIGSRAANMSWGPVPMWVVGSLIVYMFAYAVANLAISWASFRSRAI